MCLSQELAPIVVKNQGLLPCFSAEVYQGCTANLTLNKGLCLHLQSTGTRSPHTVSFPLSADCLQA